MMRLVEEKRILLAVPEGLDARWYVRPGGPRPRDDLAFAAAVVDDVQKRHPVDPARVVASGFSAGAFLTWTLACERPGRFTGFLPVAGGFWHPVPEGPCPGGPVNIRHVHGLADRTVPMAGRALSGGARQGDMRASLATALVTNACSAVPEVRDENGEICISWNGCRDGKSLTFCTHPGGHDMDGRFIAEGLDWLDTQPSAAPDVPSRNPHVKRHLAPGISAAICGRSQYRKMRMGETTSLMRLTYFSRHDLACDADGFHPAFAAIEAEAVTRMPRSASLASSSAPAPGSHR